MYFTRVQLEGHLRGGPGRQALRLEPGDITEMCVIKMCTKQFSMVLELYAPTPTHINSWPAHSDSLHFSSEDVKHIVVGKGFKKAGNKH